MHAAVWEFMRPMLSPHLAQLNRGAFVLDGAREHRATRAEHRDDSDLADPKVERWCGRRRLGDTSGGVERDL
jgi:hypothetical protein